MARRVTSRRELLRLGATAALSAGGARLLAACGGGASPAVSHPDRCAGVAPAAPAQVHAALGHDLQAMTRDLLASLGGIETVVRPGDRVFLKPNMVTLPWCSSVNDVFRLGECTKPEIVVAAAEACLQAGAAEVIIGDGSQRSTFDWSLAWFLSTRSTDLAAEARRLAAAYQRPVRCVCLDAETPEWIEVPTALSLGKVAVSSLVLEADKVISIPVAKTHLLAYFTLSMKNFIGIIPQRRYGCGVGGSTSRDALHAADHAPAQVNRLTQDLCRAVQPDLAIIDLSIGMEANGPSHDQGGTPVDVRDHLGAFLLLASTDLVAADATAARIMGTEEWKVQEVLASARDAGLGALCASDITLVGATLDEVQMHWRPARVLG